MNSLQIIVFSKNISDYTAISLLSYSEVTQYKKLMRRNKLLVTTFFY